MDAADGKTPADVAVTQQDDRQQRSGETANATADGTAISPRRAESDSATPHAPLPDSASLAETSGSGQWGRGVLSRIARSLRGRVAAIGSALAALAIGLGMVHAATERSPLPHAAGSTIAAHLAGGATSQAGSVVGTVPPPSVASAALEDAATGPGVWRVAQMADDATVSLLEGTVARRSLLAALSAAGVSRSEAKRVSGALGQVRDVDRIAAKDTFVLAVDKASGHVLAFEVVSSPVDVWQGREQADIGGGAPRLVVRKLDLTSELVRVKKAVLVGGDLRASFAEAGFDSVDDVLKLVDDALDGHAELSDIRPGARLRLVGTVERVDGAFARWATIEAVEYLPAAANATPVRVYHFASEDDAPKHRGWFDAKGKQPYHGGWRSPVPLARIASRFNPRRMHPVLHVIMPHNGVDFAAPVGAPVYATAAGTVVSVGMDGPCGNKVEIAHEGGISSVYCHLSRFATGLHPGQHVEARQLIAYVGQTGRVTGPHLHFGIKKNGVFIDPMTLRLDSVRVVPRSRRADFDRLRADLDGELDSIPLPAPPLGSAAAQGDTAPQGGDSDTFYEEQQ